MFKRIIALAIILYLGQCGGSGYANNCGNSCGGSFGGGQGGYTTVSQNYAMGATNSLTTRSSIGAHAGRTVGTLVGSTLGANGAQAGAAIGSAIGAAAGAVIGAVAKAVTIGFITILSEVVKNWACKTGPVVGQGIIASIGNGYIDLINSRQNRIKFAQCSRRQFGQNRSGFVVGDTVQYKGFLDGSDCWAQTVSYLDQRGGQQGQVFYPGVQTGPQQNLYNQYNLGIQNSRTRGQISQNSFQNRNQLSQNRNQHQMLSGRLNNIGVQSNHGSIQYNSNTNSGGNSGVTFGGLGGGGGMQVGPGGVTFGGLGGGGGMQVGPGGVTFGGQGGLQGSGTVAVQGSCRTAKCVSHK